MGYGMDEVEDKMQAMTLNAYFRTREAERKRVREELREHGYAQYDNYWFRVRRSWYRIVGKPYLSRRDWNETIDTLVDLIK